MTTLVRIQRKGQVTLPIRLLTAAGVAEGDLVQASVERGKIVLTPKAAIHRSKIPAANEEYTPRQRRMIDRELAKGLDDIKKGRVYGPFTAQEATRFIKTELKGRVAKTKQAR